MILLLALLCLAASAHAQTDAGNDLLRRVKELYAEQRWQEIVLLAPASSDADAELDLYRGLALARLERWGEARTALEAGQSKAPRDKRFPLELAGIAYKLKDFSRAKTYLKRALALDPEDAYAHDFLATIYFLQGNPEAALKSWNPTGKPQLTDLGFDPPPLLRPIFLERAFDFSLGNTWRREDYLSAQARLDQLGIFSRYRFELAANPDETFQLVVQLNERNGWGESTAEGLSSLLRGLPYQTVHPEFYNLDRSAINVISLVRWDEQKRRLFASLSAPLGQDPTWRWEVHFDGRNENWDISRTFFGVLGPRAGTNLKKAEAGVEIRSVVNGRWGWTTGVYFAHREFRNLEGIPSTADGFFTDGSSLKYDARLNYQLLRIPERRLGVDAILSGSIGKAFARPLGTFSSVRGSLALRWFPRAQGEDYQMQARLRAGRTFGGIPFDELFQLGIERDNDLWLRAHAGTRDSRKGNAPLGREFALANWELDKIVYRHPFVTLTLGPFLDTGRIADESGFFGSRKWLWDTGAQAKLRLLGSFTVILTYGKDLRSGGNTFYATAAR